MDLDTGASSVQGGSSTGSQNLRPIEALAVRPGADRRVTIEVNDVPLLLAHAWRRERPNTRRAAYAPSQAYEFVPAQLLPVLLSLYNDECQFRRAAPQRIVSTWSEWAEYEEVLGINNDDDTLANLAVEAAALLAQGSLQDVIVHGRTDEARRRELISGGCKLGVGFDYDSNGCLADSLLQTLAAKSLVPTRLRSNTAKTKTERAEACAAAREHMNSQGEELCPILRDEVGRVLPDAADAEHEAAHLDHSTHSAELVRFFMSYFESTHDLAQRGVSIIVYTRFDTTELDPRSQACILGHDGDVLELELYHNIGRTLASMRYDPVFRIDFSAADTSSTDIAGTARKPGQEPVAATALTDAAAAKGDASASLRAAEKQKNSSVKSTMPDDARPLRRDTTAPVAADFYCLRCVDVAPLGDRRGVLESRLEELADQLRERPTLPAQFDEAARQEDRAVELPAKHCAFIGCEKTFKVPPDLAAGPQARDSFMLSIERELVNHVIAEHRSAVEPVAQELESRMQARGDEGALSGNLALCEDERACFASAYNEAIAVATRRGAPLASYSIDRRCLFNYCRGVNDDSVESLICFWCARRFAYRKSAARNEIGWRTAANSIFGMPQEALASIFGLDAYLKRYGQCDADGPDLRSRPEEFDDWTMDVPYSEGMTRILCCPEDRVCDDPACAQGNVCCQQCQLPVCAECENGLVGHDGRYMMPPTALANDLMIFYAPRELYTRNVTVMEMICASPCLTSMICFTLEKKFRGPRAFDQEVHMQRHRMGARGNATSFPLPWQDILMQLGGEPDLPHTGETLSDFVSVLLKTSDEGDEKDALAHFIHQAMVRRDVVLELITKAHARGHRAYRHLDMERVRERAMSLPVEGIPEGIAKLLPYDDLLNKIQVQKAATPVPGRTDLDGVARQLSTMKPNGVVLEKSSYDEADINAQRIAALQHFTQRLNGELEANGDASSESSDAEENGAKRRRADAALPVNCGASVTARPQSQPRPKRARLSDADAERVVHEQKRNAKVERFAVSTGNQMIDQFEPWYFGVAFAFLFKYCTGMPDMPAFTKRPRYRRGADAPRVEADLWVRVMSRRVEAQLNRDWQFGFVTWNYLFRSSVNLSRTFFAYQSAKQTQVGGEITRKDIEVGAVEVCKALWGGKYTDLGGRTQKVNGDMTKVQNVPGLSVSARKLLKNIEHTSRRLAGTQETRRLMRFDTHANRICYGVPIFVTFSPDEAHNVLMIRLSRTRRRDPVFTDGADPVGERFCGRRQPRIAAPSDDVELRIPVSAVIDALPTYDERRKLLARDSLASVDGFRVLVLATYEYLFGMRVCPYCPNCNCSHIYNPCQDHFGSNAFTMYSYANRWMYRLYLKLNKLYHGLAARISNAINYVPKNFHLQT